MITVLLGISFYIGMKLSEQFGDNYLRSHFYIDIDPRSVENKVELPSQNFTAELNLKNETHDNYLDITLSGGDVYKVEFLLEDKSDFIVISTVGNGERNYLYFIPEQISGKGYEQIRVSVMKGDGDYWLQNISTFKDPNLLEFHDHEIIDFEIKKMEIEIGEEELLVIKEKRTQALELGILLTEDDDYVPAVITADGKTDDIEIRLKGDWTEHLNGEKWSFRIKMDDECVWGMKKFSIHRPETRKGAAEYLIHAFYRDQGGVTLRYEFVDVIINSEYKGVYAMEEFFDKRLIENSQRREGPIIKPNEDHLWERWAYYPYGYTTYLNFTEFDVFGTNKILENAALTGDAQYAITLLNKYIADEIDADEVFDLDIFARYLATLDVFSACHGSTWHNMRFYYNPITARLEPITFDEEPLFGLCRSASKKDEFLINPLFDNEEFVSLYVHYLETYLEVYDGFIQGEQEDLSRIAYIFRRDWVPYENISSSLKEQHEYIRSTLHEDESDLFVERTTAGQIVLTFNKFSYLNSRIQKITYDGFPLDIDYSDYEEEIRLDPDKLDIEIDDLEKFEITYQTLYNGKTHKKNAKLNRVDLSFYVAGHVYGSPNKANSVGQDEVHKPFVDALPAIAGDDEISFGILTGDTVYSPSEKSYGSLISTMAETGKPYYVVPGNHDLKDPELFKDFFENEYQAFTINRTLFILLTPREDWKIDDEQFEFLENMLKNKHEVSNIFVFTHQLFWLEKNDERFPGVTPNSWDKKKNESNFWDQIKPVFSNFERDVYFIAGDVGAFEGRNSVVYERDGNLHFIASGMGGGAADNYIVADVYSDGGVKFDLIALNGDNPGALGSLTDW